MNELPDGWKWMTPAPCWWPKVAAGNYLAGASHHCDEEDETTYLCAMGWEGGISIVALSDSRDRTPRSIRPNHVVVAKAEVFVAVLLRAQTGTTR